MECEGFFEAAEYGVSAGESAEQVVILPCVAEVLINLVIEEITCEQIVAAHIPTRAGICYSTPGIITVMAFYKRRRICIADKLPHTTQPVMVAFSNC